MIWGTGDNVGMLLIVFKVVIADNRGFILSLFPCQVSCFRWVLMRQVRWARPQAKSSAIILCSDILYYVKMNINFYPLQLPPSVWAWSQYEVGHLCLRGVDFFYLALIWPRSWSWLVALSNLWREDRCDVQLMRFNH